MSIRKIYISGAYTAPTPEEVDANVKAAKAVGMQVRALGFVPVVPHIAIVPDPSLTWSQAMDECLALLSDCHGILMFGPWNHSKGARAEYVFAVNQDIPAFFSLEELAAGMEARP